jgi:hypothetical protein
MSCRVRVGVQPRYLFDNKLDSNEVMIALAGISRLLYDVGMHRSRVCVLNVPTVAIPVTYILHAQVRFNVTTTSNTLCTKKWLQAITHSTFLHILTRIHVRLSRKGSYTRKDIRDACYCTLSRTFRVTYMTTDALQPEPPVYWKLTGCQPINVSGIPRNHGRVIR